MKHIIVALVFVMALPFSWAEAEEDNLGLTLFGPFLHSTQVPNTLFLLTDIGSNDSWELRRALRTHDVDTIILASNGGSVAEGLRMAGIIFDKQLTTYVPDSPSADGCYSACAYMFFAGKNKLSEGQLGVHQIGYYEDKAAGSANRKQGDTLEQAQYTTSEVIGFLNEFETPPWVYERMFRSKEMYIFTAEEKVDLNTGEVPEITKKKVRDFLGELTKYGEALDNKEDPEPTVVKFDKSDKERVKAFQKLLNLAECAAGTADGVWGRKTNSAASRFAKTNGLSYNDFKSINQAYVEKLVSETRAICPPLPKPKKKTNLAGSWSFDLSCRNGSVKGWAKITFSHKKGNTSWYHVNYTNNLKQNFQGLATNNNGRFNYSINQTNGPSHSKGEGRVSANMRTLQGLSEAGCAFQSRRR
jgi:hypothetical protein